MNLSLMRKKRTDTTREMAWFKVLRQRKSPGHFAHKLCRALSGVLMSLAALLVIGCAGLGHFTSGTVLVCAPGPDGFVDVTHCGATARSAPDTTFSCATGGGDEVAIRAALEAGPNLRFPRGIYDLCETITVYDHPTYGVSASAPAYRDSSRIIEGAGTGAIPQPGREYLLGEHRTVLLNHTGGAALRIGALAPTTVAQLSIHESERPLPGKGGIASVGILAEAPIDANVIVRLRDVWVEGHQDGVRLVRPMVSLLQNVTVNRARRDGFHVLGPGTSTTFTNCFSRLAGRDGFHILEMSYSQLSGCASDKSGRYGYFMGDRGSNRRTRSESLVMIGSGAEYAGYGNICGAGIRAENVNSLSLIGVHVTQPGDQAPDLSTNGISLSGGRGMTVVSPFIANHDVAIAAHEISAGNLTVIQPRFAGNGRNVTSEKGGVWKQLSTEPNVALDVSSRETISLSCSPGGGFRDFTGAVPGQQLHLVFTDSNCTVDFGNGLLHGNGERPWRASLYASLVCTYSGEAWYCVGAP